MTPFILAALALAGCGGGGSGDASSQPPTQTVSGVVIDGPIQGATVCLDLNSNGTCDAGEPVSTPTDAQGNYTIADVTAAQLSSGAPWLAVIPASAIDADAPGVPVGKAFALWAPAGKPLVISPVTHLVQLAVSQGMTLANAEATVATQLQVQAASLYANYVGVSGGDGAALLRAVPTIVASLQAGEQLDVVAPATSSPGYTVRLLNFTNAQNYSLRYFFSDNVPDQSTGVYTFYDRRAGLTNGTSTPTSALYDSALFATPQGWIAAGADVANVNTAGSPSISTWGTGFAYVSSRVDVDVSGLAIADVVRMAQDLSANSQSSIVGVNADQLSGTMPAGAKVRHTKVTPTAVPVKYRESDGFIGFGVTTLAGMVAAFPVPAPATVLSTSNTVSLGALHSEGCGAAFCAQERLRGAFGPDNSVTYYLCDIDVSTGSQTNCTTQGAGSYSQGTAADGVTPIMTFAGLPATASVQEFSRVFVQRNGHVYFGSQEKVVAATHTRLNRVAFEALANVLGITAPTVASTSPYAGTWTASYTGMDTGGCATITISASGQLSGSCTSTGVGGTFAIIGSVDANGGVTFSATSSGASFTGVLGSASGSGSWNWPSRNASGTWTVGKQ